MTTTRSFARAVAAGAAMLLLAPLAALAAGGSAAATTPVDPRRQAKESYNRALKYHEKASDYEQQAAGAGEAEAEKLLKKAEKEHQKAIRALRSATDGDPGMFQAFSSLGYSLRKIGEYEEALAAYDRALELRSDYTEAIEYRAEAYLGLNRLEEAKEAYMQLLRADRQRADELMAAMRSWIETRRADPGGVDAEVVESFAAWVDERSDLAAQIGAPAQTAGRSW